MFTVILRAYLALTTTTSVDVADEIAHRACEVALYQAVAPDVADDETTPGAELLAELLCRNEPMWGPPDAATEEYPQLASDVRTLLVGYDATRDDDCGQW